MKQHPIAPLVFPGRCYIKAGFKHVGETKGGLVALQMLPDAMPEPISLLESA